MSVNGTRMLPGADEGRRAHGIDQRDGRGPYAVWCPPVGPDTPEEASAVEARRETAGGTAHPVVQAGLGSGETAFMAAAAVAAAGTAVFVLAVTWLGMRRRRRRNRR